MCSKCATVVEIDESDKSPVTLEPKSNVIVDVQRRGTCQPLKATDDLCTGTTRRIDVAGAVHGYGSVGEYVPEGVAHKTTTPKAPVHGTSGLRGLQHAGSQ